MKLIINPDVGSIEELEKGRKAVPIGTRRQIKGTKYWQVRTATGWAAEKVQKKAKPVVDAKKKDNTATATAPDAGQKDNKTASTATDTQVSDKKKDVAPVAKKTRAKKAVIAGATKQSAPVASKDSGKENRFDTPEFNGYKKEMFELHKEYDATTDAAAREAIAVKVNAIMDAIDVKHGMKAIAFIAQLDKEYQEQNKAIVATAPVKKTRAKKAAVPKGNAPVANTKTVNNKPDAPKVDDKKQESVKTQTFAETKGLQAFDKAKMDLLVSSTMKRNRMSAGQGVEYLGNYHKGLNGKRGKLVAIGEQGYAVVKFDNGDVKTAAWTDLKAVGPIQPHSLYDNLHENQVYHATGEFRSKLDKILDSTFDKSGITYRKLCEEFKSRGFNLQIVGGTVRDILSDKKDINDVDFIFNGTDRELQAILGSIYPKWISGKVVTNKHSGLVSFSDSGEAVDITPVHKFSPELKDMAKGWNLKEDAMARDIAMNTLQIDPLTGIMVDGTGKALKDIENNTINFTDDTLLKHAPTYIMRAFKFVSRGYKLSDESHKAIKDNMKYIDTLSPQRLVSFLQRQIKAKDGVDGMKKFRNVFMSYDATLWNKRYKDIYKNLGGV